MITCAFSNAETTDGRTLATHRVQIEDAAEPAGALGPAVTGDAPDSVRALVAPAGRRD